MSKRIIKSTLRILCIVAIVVLGMWWLIAQPTFQRNQDSVSTLDADRLKAHVSKISQTFYPRDWSHTDNLDKCADYIAMHFTEAGADVEFQTFHVQGRQYSNIIGRFSVGRGSKIIIGAHYDAYGETPGADDNASGVAALIELAYLIATIHLTRKLNWLDTFLKNLLSSEHKKWVAQFMQRA